MSSLSFEQVRKMRRGVNAFDVYLFPYMTDVEVAIRVLSQEEIFESINVWQQKLRDKYPNAWQDQEIHYGTRELLHKAILKKPVADERDKFFASPEELGELSIEEFNLLLEHYNEVQEKYAPDKTLESEEDVMELIEEIKKNSLVGMSLSTHTLRRLVVTLAKPSETLQNDNGSTSLPSKKSKAKTKRDSDEKLSLRTEPL